jgi:hypothetical protein
MKAYPPDDERFVKRRTSVKNWPVFSDQAGSIAQNAVPGQCTRSPLFVQWTGIGKRCGVYLANHRARARLTDLESKVYVRVQRLDQINAN